MSILRVFPVVLALTALAPETRAQDRVGDVYEVRVQTAWEVASDDGSSGRSQSTNTLQERVLALRDNGVELEFDLPTGTSPEDRARNWQLPVRALAAPGRPLELLNHDELEARVPAWLERWNIEEAACGKWFFTWTAVKVECDPASALGIVEPFNLRLALREGALYGGRGAREPVPLRLQSAEGGRQVFTAVMAVDPDLVRRARADSDVVASEILGEPITLEAALERWTAKDIAGTMTDTIVTDEGRTLELTSVTTLVITDADGSRARETTTTTVLRRLTTP